MNVDAQRLRRAYQTAREALLAERTPDGHWVGELSSSALSTATAVSALALLFPHQSAEMQPRIKLLIENGLRWIFERQNVDGGWGDTDLSVSNISTTMLVRAAAELASKLPNLSCSLSDLQRQAAEQYIESKGGIPGLRRRYGKDKTFAVPILTNYALAGLVSWREVSALPFEAACLPQSWYRFARLPVVSYAIPALVAIGQAKFSHDPPRNPLVRFVRRLSVRRSLSVLQKMQPASGGYLEATPLTSFVVMSLASIGLADHPVSRLGMKFLLDSVRSDGSWPIDTNLATWVTTLAINALAPRPSPLAGEGGERSEPGEGLVEPLQQVVPLDETKSTATQQPPHPTLSRKGRGEEECNPLVLSEQSSPHPAFGHLLPVGEGRADDVFTPQLLNWLLGCQMRERHPFTGAEPGGWGWSDLSGSVPDADDTPGALLALNLAYSCGKELSDDPLDAFICSTEFGEAPRAGMNWLAKLQNRDGGWPTFCRGWGQLPFDRSGSDLTAHAIRALSTAGNDILEDEPFYSRLTQRGLAYLTRHQRPDGSWLPLWFGNQHRSDDENPLYGTAKVLMAYRDLKWMNKAEAQRAISYLLGEQNADGGWGGGPTLERGAVVGPQRSSVEETALVVEALLAAPPTESLQAAVSKGLNWLIEAVETGDFRQPSPIGFYFAKLWYYEKLYPIIFTVSALSHAVDRLSDGTGSTAPRV